ncbi:MAG TPA: hypothetical protein VJB92_02760 [Candidatus Paceibacterota bacterium]
MPESQGQFEHAALEKEIKELTKEIEQSGNLEQGKEAIKEAIGERIYKSPLPPETEQASQAQPQTSKEKAKDTSSLPSYAGKLPAEAKLRAEQILDLAWHKGINAAIKEVRKTDPLTMDLFHDAITEKLYQEFKKRRILK